MSKQQKMHPCPVNMTRTKTSPLSLPLLACVVTLHSASTTVAFSPPQKLGTQHTSNKANTPITRTHNIKSTKLHNLFPDDDDDEEDLEAYDYKTAAQIRKARQLLKDAKKKIERQTVPDENNDINNTGNTNSMPFFASTSKIKSSTSSGIIADGATMTSISAGEAWEARRLNDMFVREPRSDYDGNLVEEEVGHDGLSAADKDLARNIMGLKRMLQGDDFKKVFDQRNRWIGDIE